MDDDKKRFLDTAEFYKPFKNKKETINGLLIVLGILFGLSIGLHLMGLF